MKTERTFLYHIKPDDQISSDLRRSNTASEGHNSGGNRPQHKGIPSWIRSLLIVGLILASWYLVQFFFSPGTQTNGQPVVEIPYSTFYQQVEAGNVKNAVIEGQEVIGEFKQAVTVKDTQGTSQTVSHYRTTQLSNGDPNLVTLLNEHQVEYQAKAVGSANLLLGILL